MKHFNIKIQKSYLAIFLLFLINSVNCKELCDRWIVITTINYPSAIFNTLVRLKEWRVVVIADKKTPKDWYFPNVIFLSVEDQEKLTYKIIKLLPWNHYSRKNIGYLYAIEHGAKIIYETDDDNFPLYESIPCLDQKDTCLCYDTCNPVVNPYAHFGQPSVWPRGYPLKQVCKSDCTSFEEITDLFIPIQQGLVNKDPDVDAIFRLTRNELIDFDAHAVPVALKRGTMAPFNSQNTIYYHSAFWGLLMPMGVTFRVSDIWRGYWVQRLLWDIGGSLCFLPPNVFQVRNEHDILKDFLQELDLYLKVDSLILMLNSWQSDKKNLFERMENLFECMVQERFFESNDLELAKAWIEDLTMLGYEPPALKL